MNKKQLSKQKIPKSPKKPEKPYWKSFSDDPDEFRMDCAIHVLDRILKEKKKRTQK